MNNKSSIDNRYLADDAMIERDERAASRKKKEKKVAAISHRHWHARRVARDDADVRSGLYLSHQTH